ncbi:DUF4123 domain-containing protein [Pseudomonas syringae pv. tagetis]|uniref:DUF4123 domain-containing protein n=1 Tax=Pseudomonas syringae pv. tagetis TaxID=129140 RepID=A0A0Q0B2F5_9PSED|nr:DUF4123 domain-containing protein [Pseudomonas syringae group genomosp. 7]KPY82465.1 Uncharacterized protein ALO44_02675 [Pseudomonas syringae pv. tagetis]RMW16823.1 hypothetical protein ALO97_03769 [Pseudomonas syringae pv. tagetis]RMW17770.1 hypothetical protein ALO98_02830 [Pseudomonas syringae pv. tagetis]UNB70959.1 DUF4123 domain-containing protein [Pseudomonas syringae pv. tagetis]
MNQANYLLIDGALRPDAIKQLYQLEESLEIAPLYLDTPWTEVMGLGPILVHAPHPSSLIQEWQGHSEQRADACVFSSNASLKIVSAHLQQFLSPTDDLGNSSLLRFADPLVMHYWLSSYGAEYLSAVLGPIDQLWVQSPFRSWQHCPGSTITTFVNQRAQQASRKDFTLLGDPQLKAFARCYRWLFEERIHGWVSRQYSQAFVDQSDDQIEDWLSRALDSALEWGLTSEYALATWADICGHWGLDFITSPQGHYLSWQTLHPEHQRLAPELRIDALDEYRQKVRNGRGAPHDQ